MLAPAFAQNATAHARERLDEQDEKVRFEWCASIVYGERFLSAA
jgi:hypothetical protein